MKRLGRVKKDTVVATRPAVLLRSAVSFSSRSVLVGDLCAVALFISSKDYVCVRCLSAS